MREQERHHKRSDIYMEHKILVRFSHEEMNGGQGSPSGNGKVGSRQEKARSSSSIRSGLVLGDKVGEVGCAI